MKTSLSMQVGQSVAKFRKLAGMTQAEAAGTLNVENETISRMETGAISLTLERLSQFSELYKCPIASFFIDPSGQPDALAATIADLIRPLKPAELEILLHFVSVTVSLFRKAR
jgi:transcriptional regulator with XRE-family HTH domain